MFLVMNNGLDTEIHKYKNKSWIKYQRNKNRFLDYLPDSGEKARSLESLRAAQSLLAVSKSIVW